MAQKAAPTPPVEFQHRFRIRRRLTNLQWSDFLCAVPFVWTKALEGDLGPAPNPSAGTASASTATGGKVCPIAATERASGSRSRPAGRVTKIANPTATRVETTTAAVTSARCDRVSRTRLVWV